MKIINLKNKTEDSPNGVYIGRMNSKFHFGNPFSHLENSLAAVKVNTKQEAIEMHWFWLKEIFYRDVEPERRRWILKHLNLLENKDLECFCDGECHGNNYIKLIEENENSKI